MVEKLIKSGCYSLTLDPDQDQGSVSPDLGLNCKG